MQKALYTAVHGNPAFAGIAVDYFTGYAAGANGVGPDPSTTPGLADADTQHPYPNFGQAPGYWVDPATATPNETGQKGRVVYTETGYSSNGGTSGGVDQAVQARYTLDLLFDDMKNGVAETDLYELMDAYKTGSPQGNAGFGLFNLDGTAKPVATAIGNLTTILADTGSNAATFQTSAFAPTVTGLPATGKTLVLQKSSGVTDIVVWAEPQIWNEATGTEVAAPARTVTVDLGGVHHAVSVYDPLVGSSPIQTLTDVSTAQIVVTDHPLILEVGPATPPPAIAITGQVLAQDTGTSSSDNITKVGGVTLSGTMSGTAGTAVTVFDGTTALGQASLTGAGGWTFATTLAAGAHSLHAVASDPTGMSATSTAAAPITVLTAAPTITLATETIGTDGKTVTLAGTVSGASGTVVTVADGTVPLGTATLDGKGGWQLLTTLAAGHHTLTATATDLAGNTAAVDPPLTVPDPAPAVTPDLLVLEVSEDAYDGDAQFTVSVDGQQVGGVQTATASHQGPLWQSVALTGQFGSGPHTVGVNFLNDAYGGAPTKDRNLYVRAITLDGTTTVTNTAQASGGLKTYGLLSPAPAPALTPALTPAPALIPAVTPDLLVLEVSEDAYDGDAQFTVSVDGQQVGGVQTATASHQGPLWQSVALTGQFGSGPHTVGVNFLNDAYGGAPTKDRNLYVRAITLDGTTTVTNTAQASGGLKTYGLLSPAPALAPAPATAALAIAAGATLILDKTSAAGAAVTFAGPGAIAQFTDATSFHGSLAGFGGSDVIDLRSVGGSGSLGLSYAGSGPGGTLTVTDGTHVTNLAMQGSYSTANFAAASDHFGGTAITFRA